MAVLKTTETRCRGDSNNVYTSNPIPTFFGLKVFFSAIIGRTISGIKRMYRWDYLAV